MTRPNSIVIAIAITAAGLLTTACPGSKDDGGQEGVTTNDEDGQDGETTFGMPGDGPGNTVTSGATMGSNSQGDPDDDSGGFLQPPDGGVVGQCDPYTQDCPRGEKCTSYVQTPGEQTVDATKCVPILGDDLWGEPCERFEDNDTCALGFFCMTDVSGNTGMGTCLEYCSPGIPCEFGGECFAFNDGVLPVCEVTCDPLLQDCPPDQGCYAAFDNFVCAMPGAPDGQGNDGDPCNTIQSCNPGLICRTGTQGCPMDGACCTPVCELGGPDVCTASSEDCVPALDDPPPGLMNVGYCSIPA